MRIGIVNDMVVVVELLRRIVSAIPDYKIAWVAYDGAEAVRRCAADPPDLILMDLIMPVMGGVEATSRIMETNPCAILIVTASVLGNISKVFEAMGHGALDVVRTPSLGADIQSEGTRALLQKMEMISRLIGRAKAPQPAEPSEQQLDPLAHDAIPPLVALGASTGGPFALRQILPCLPANFPAPVVVIQHVDPHFAEGFVRWLAERCVLPVQIAQEGEVPRRGVIFVAGTTDHLVIDSSRRMYYTSRPADCIYKPSVDVFFESLRQHWPTRGVAALLTGMGRDGAQGMMGLADSGWLTIAQHKSSCVVYGMPKAAVELEAAQEVLPLAEIGPKIVAALGLAKSIIR